MASKTTINFDDEMEAALDELAAIDGTKRLAIKRSLLAEVKRRRRSQALSLIHIYFGHLRNALMLIAVCAPS